MYIFYGIQLSLASFPGSPLLRNLRTAGHRKAGESLEDFHVGGSKVACNKYTCNGSGPGNEAKLYMYMYTKV